MISTNAGLLGRRLGFRQHRRDKAATFANGRSNGQSSTTVARSHPDDLGALAKVGAAAERTDGFAVAVALAPVVDYEFVHLSDSTLMNRPKNGRVSY